MATPTQTPVADTATDTFLRIFRATVVVVVMVWLGYFIYTSAFGPAPTHPFKLGLDLAGGSHLVYVADTTKVSNQADVPDLMGTLRNVIEKRVNSLGVEENSVYLEESSFAAEEKQYRLVVELPGVTDVSQAVAEIGRTPLLEFKLVDDEVMAAKLSVANLQAVATSGAVIGNVSINGESANDLNPYIETGLNGSFLESAALEFTSGNSGQLANEPIVSLRFNEAGGKLFADITRANVGVRLAIFLDGEVVSSPNINEAITGGTAIISGGFDAAEAKELAENLNLGALPLPIALASTQTIDASLGAGVMRDSVMAGAIGLILISIFMIMWYRLPGVVATVALCMYVLISVALFLFIPVTLTAAGLAGLVLSLGMAVDGNVLVFERMKEEFRAGKSSRAAATEGFARAWSAIRDGNVTALLSAIILFWFGTSLIKGFALVLGIGTIISMLSAITLTRTFLLILPDVKREDEGILPYLFGTGFTKK